MKFSWINDHSRIFFERGYLEKGVVPEQRVRQIADAAERYLNIAGFGDKFYDYMSRGWISLASPIWSNYGLARGLPCSCNGQFVDDTMESILLNAAEMGVMTKHGAGTSGYFGKLRGRGVPISGGGESSGPVHFLEIYDSISSVVSQSNVRRGSFAAYLDVEHPDILEFLEIRKEGHRIQDTSIGVCIGDDWMNAMVSGDKKKRKVWAAIIQKRFETGYPYIFFTDTVNNNKPQVYKDKDVKIHASNLCVAGDQRVVSNKGLLTARELYELGEDLTLFDNNKNVKSSKMQLIEKDADTYKVVLENGLSHTITGYHKVLHRANPPNRPTKLKNTECKDLSVGDYVAFQTSKGLFGNVDMPNEAFLLGLYQGDGTQDERNIHICVWENDFDLLEDIQHKFDYVYNLYGCKNLIKTSKDRTEIPRFKESNTGFSKVRKKSLISPALRRCLNFEKGHVPQWIWSANEKTQWEYIKGLYYADGTVNISTKSKGSPLYLSISNINKEFLEQLQILLLNLGITTSISKGASAGPTMLPDNKGGYKLYNTKDCYRLVCGSKNDAIIFEKNTGFLTRKGITLSKENYRDNTKKFSKIKSIEYVGKQDVYCLTVDSEEHHWICNGFITHNCSEIALSSSNEESFVCVLSSVNLLHYDEWKNTDLIETMMFFLDTVTEEYIIKTKDIKLLEKAHNFAKNQRAVGLGTLGWHSYLQSNNIAFESMEAKIKNAAIFKDMHLKSLEASKKLASIYGEPPMLKGYGERFVTRLSVAPNVSCTTADTKFLDGDGNSINFHQLFKRGGLDLNDYLYTEVIGSNGESIKMNPYDKVSIMRDSERLVVQVVDLEEGDEIIELTNKW